MGGLRLGGLMMLGCAACSHDWEGYDPRGGGAAGGGAAGVGGQSSSTDGTGATTSGGGTPATSTGAGGASGSTGGAGGAATPAGLVAAYSFDEGAGAELLDATSNHNDGTVSGASWVAGKHGGALAFDGGADHVRIPANASWKEDGVAEYTVEAWIKVTAVGNYEGAIAVGAWSNGSVSLTVQDGQWAFNVRTVGGPNDWPCTAWSAPLPYLEQPDDQFHHVAGVYRAALGDCLLYLDGVLSGTDDYVDGSVVFGAGDLMLGGFDGSNYLACEIDDVRIYKRALDEAEIAADMTAAVTP